MNMETFEKSIVNIFINIIPINFAENFGSKILLVPYEKVFNFRINRKNVVKLLESHSLNLKNELKKF